MTGFRPSEDEMTYRRSTGSMNTAVPDNLGTAYGYRVQKLV